MGFDMRIAGAVLLAGWLSLTGCSSSAIPVVNKDSGYRSQRAMPVSGEHRVRSGDTLYSIAWVYGTDFKALAQLNGIRSPYVIRPGQRIKLRGKPTSGTVLASSSAVKMASRTADAVQPLAADKSWRWPASGKLLSGFGQSGGNKGIDISGNIGDSVVTARAGKVVYAGNGIRGYGNLLIVKHSAEFLSAYAYNSRLLVKEGDLVKEGQKIAEIGNSGAAREAKLHFEIRRQGKPVDPVRLLPRRG